MNSSSKSFRLLHILWFWLPPVFLAILIFIVSSISKLSPLPAPGYSDKVIHLTVYAIFSFFIIRALIAGQGDQPVRFKWIIALVIACLYGASDEIHQMFVPGRTPEWLDLIFDWLGSALGILIYFRITRIRRVMEDS